MDIFNFIIFITFIPAVVGICYGIWHEEKLIRWEQKQWKKIKRFFKKLLKNV